MTNGSKVLAGAIWVALGTGPSAPAMAGQDVQSADGAQQFLAATIKQVPTQVVFVDPAGRANYVTGKYTGEIRRTKGSIRKPKETVETLPERVVDKQVSGVSASVLEAIDAHGRRNPCATRITQVTAPTYDEVKSDSATENRAFSWTITYTNEAWTYEPLAKFMTPAQVIDWSNARVTRSAPGTITVSSKGQAYPAIHLTYAAADPNLADRIEYAMKFLALSCDATAASRF